MLHRYSGLLAALLLSAGTVLPQEEVARFSFEVASVKPAEEGRGGLGPLRGGPGTSSPGQLSGTVSLMALLMRAYGLKDYQVSGPAWMESQRYDIAAKIPAGATRTQVSLMLRMLLEARFGLVTHREARETAVSALVVGKGGPKLKASAPKTEEDVDTLRVSPKFTKGADGFPDIAGGESLPRSYEMVIGGSDGLMYKLWARRETMEQLADRLSAQLSRPVVDETGLKETYDFALTWTLENGGAGVPRTGAPLDEIDMHNGPILSEPGPTIFAALQTQLGLRMEQRRGPMEMLIVDKAERIPTGN
jgi:uncharacterized protein (TIGR03435 family)